MKYFVLACALFAASSHAADVVRLSEPVAQTATHEVFGAPMPSMDAVQSLGQLVADAERYLDQDVVLRTRIAKVCQKKGCFFVATGGAATVRVSFKDYEFFIPTDAGGKKVALAGTFGRKAISAEQAAHYAKDLGDEPSADTPQFEYVIVATSISIPKGG
ncbi:MAG: hypothetical protein ACI9J0_002336 [Cryomorphaceae bacterium]|jgi:hypothetical protein